MGVQELAVLAGIAVVGLVFFAVVVVAAYFFLKPLFVTKPASDAFQGAAAQAGLAVEQAASAGPHPIDSLGSQDRTSGERHGVLVEARLAHPQLNVRGVEGNRVTICRARLDPPLGLSFYAGSKATSKRSGPKIKTGNPQLDSALVVQSLEGERAATLLGGEAGSRLASLAAQGLSVHVSPTEVKVLHAGALDGARLEGLLDELAATAASLVALRASLPASPAEQEFLQALRALAAEVGWTVDEQRREARGAVSGFQGRLWLGGSPAPMLCVEIVYPAPLGMELLLYHPHETGVEISEEGADRGVTIAFGQAEHPELDQSDIFSHPGWAGALRRQVVVKGRPVERLRALLDEQLIARLEAHRARGDIFSFEDRRALLAAEQTSCTPATMKTLVLEAATTVQLLGR